MQPEAGKPGGQEEEKGWVARGGWLFKNENPLSRGWWEKSIILKSHEFRKSQKSLFFDAQTAILKELRAMEGATS